MTPQTLTKERPSVELAFKLAEMEAQAQGVLAARYCPHQPMLRQRMFLRLPYLEALYGGQAAGGKSDALLMGALEYVDVPGYAALLLRRTFKDLSLPGALMDRAQRWLSGTPAKWNGEKKTWTFPSGATITFGYLDNENDKFQYQSSEFHYIGFDELTQFTDTQYTYLFTRLRRTQMPCLTCAGALEMQLIKGLWQWKHEESAQTEHLPEADASVLMEYPSSAERQMTAFQIPPRMRGGTNPGGIGAEWVKSRFIPDDFMPEDAVEAKIWTKVYVNEEETEIETAFVPSRKEDNPFADSKSYQLSLDRADRVTRAQLGRGDWTITATGRLYFVEESIRMFTPTRGTDGEMFTEVDQATGAKIPMWKPTTNGWTAIWRKPQRGHFYAAGADTAQGKDANKGQGTAKGDWSVCNVRDVDSGEQVARFRARVNERAFAVQLWMLLSYYNLAFLVPEMVGGQGRAMLDHLVLDLYYPISHIFCRKAGSVGGNPVTPELDDLGWVTGPTTRNPLISALDAAIQVHSIETYDPITINEYMTFEYNKVGKPEARQGCFDDCVLADALSVVGIEYFPVALRREAQAQAPKLVTSYGGKQETEAERMRKVMAIRRQNSLKR